MQIQYLLNLLNDPISIEPFVRLNRQAVNLNKRPTQLFTKTHLV